MKKSILTITALTCISLLSLTSCDNTAQNVADAKSEVKEANMDLEKANKEHEAEVEKFRKEAAEKIAENEKSIAEFKARKAADKKIATDDYNKKLEALEHKNSDMKKQMDDYKFTSEEKWELFKTEFSNGLSEIGKAFTDLTASNDK